jgi:hypothetical protein
VIDKIPELRRLGLQLKCCECTLSTWDAWRLNSKQPCRCDDEGMQDSHVAFHQKALLLE